MQLIVSKKPTYLTRTTDRGGIPHHNKGDIQQAYSQHQRK